MTELLDAAPADPSDGRILNAAWIDTPIGVMLAVANARGLLRLDFSGEERAEMVFDALRKVNPDRPDPIAIVRGTNQHLDQLRAELAEYFQGTRRGFGIPLIPVGTSFNCAWEYLRKIPFGQTRTYGQQAKAIGNANASRAVGGANGRNPLGLIVPCHRVIGANGTLTGFGGGIERKQWLLNHERKVAGNNDLFS